MAGIDEFKLGSPENQSINPRSQNTDIENPDSDSKQPIEHASISNKSGSCLTCYMPIPKLIRYKLFCLLFVCLAPVAYVCVTAATVGIFPLLLAAFVVLRLLQFVIQSENFEDVPFEVKFLLRYWMFVVVILLLLEAGIFYPIAKNVPGLKVVMIIGLPITEWIKIICTVIGIYLLSFVVWTFVAYIMETLDMFDDSRKSLILEVVSEIVDCLLFRWAVSVVMNSVPTFKRSKVCGIRIQKWVEVSLFLLIGYNILAMLTHMLVWSLPKVYGDHLRVGKIIKLMVCCEELGNAIFNERYVVYVACGIKRSIIFILSAVMLLLTWVLYFGDLLKTTSEDKNFFRFGTWTLVCVLMCSFLWLIKSCILLYWEAHAVYNRLHSKIADIGKHLYFVVLLTYTHFKHAIETRARVESPSDKSPGCGLTCSNTPPKRKERWILSDNNKWEGENYIPFDRKVVREELFNRIIGPKASIYDIQLAVKQFLTTQHTLSKENISRDLYDLIHRQSDNSGEINGNIIQVLKKIVQVEGVDYFDDDWKMLLELLAVEETTKEIFFPEVKTWMERAHSRCSFLANTLISEKEVAKCLNQVISGFIIGVTFIVWLLLTGLATTKVLVLIASPLLAATFIFGDTCKSLFQGLIFVYAVHPFDVGDLCLIDEKLLEVKRIGVWSTTFVKVRTVGKKHDVMYPNSDLAIKNVVNHKSEFDWNDYIEFCLSSPKVETAKDVKHQIETYLDTEKERFTPNFHSVEFLEVGDKAKIAVHIKHNIQTHGWTYFECLKEKEKRRFEFALYIQNIVNNHELKNDTPEILVQTDQTVTGDDH